MLLCALASDPKKHAPIPYCIQLESQLEHLAEAMDDSDAVGGAEGCGGAVESMESVAR